MTPTEAAKIYRETSERLAAVAADLKLHEEAGKVLKEHAKANPELTSYRKVAFNRGTQKRFSAALAKQKLGPRQVQDCMVTVDTIGLTIV